MEFELTTPARVIFGAGRLKEVGRIAAELGTRALVVTGRNTERATVLLQQLHAYSVPPVVFPVDGEPTVDTARAGVEQARHHGCDLVIAFGGGSAIDGAKAIAALLGNGGDPLDYLEVVGLGLPLTRPSAPFIAIPTTAGTGSEVTKNAVLGSPADRVKASLRSPLMLPRVAVLDPALLAGLPPAVIASSGLDALSQLIEPFLSLRANALTDALARDGIRRSARALRRSYEHGPSHDDRDDLAVASLFGGLCLANAGLGAVHGFAAPIGGRFTAPHGAICAALLPHVLRTNLAALTARAPGSPATARVAEIAELCTGRAGASAEEGIAWIAELCAAMRVPPLSSYGVTEADLPVLVEKAKNASSMKANPIALTDEELTAILRAAL